jgi:hypothetical protein
MATPIMFSATMTGLWLSVGGADARGCDVPGDGEDLAYTILAFVQICCDGPCKCTLTISCLALIGLGLLLLLLWFLPPRSLATALEHLCDSQELTGPIFATGISLRSVLLLSFNAMGGGGGGSLTSSRCGVVGGLLGSGTVRGSTASSNKLVLLEKDEI